MYIDPDVCQNLFLLFMALAFACHFGKELTTHPGARYAVVAASVICAVLAAIVALVC